VHAQASRAGVPVVTAAYGESRRLGTLRWQVIAPSAPPPPDSDSPPNDESIVLYVETRGVRLLLMGDEETGSQQRLHALFPDLHADVLKVAHHGSAKQAPDLVAGLGARVALVSVGRGNDYGHPAPSALALLDEDHLRTWRTDRDGSLAVAVTHAGGGLAVVGRH
jgi:competence protein ComEC